MGVLVSAGIGTVSKSEQHFSRTWVKSASVSRAGRIHPGAGASTRKEGRNTASSNTPRQVSSIEINGSFYSLQRPESYRAPGMKRRRKASSSRSKAAFLPKGRDGGLIAESASRPASCERTHILQQSDRRQQSFALDAASWRFATRPSPNKKAACSPKRVKLPGNQHGLHLKVA